MSVSVRTAFPVLINVVVCGLLIFPTPMASKFNLAGDGDRNGPFTPMPANAMACGLLRVPSVMVSVPVSRPVAPGEKVTVTVQVIPGVRLTGQLLVAAKLALATKLAIVKGTLLGLPIVMV